MSFQGTVEKLIDAKIEKALQGGSQTVLAEYKGLDSQGKGWVIVAGSTESTPITRATVEAAPGDTVSVTIGDGQCVMDANISNPSAGVVGVQKATQTAEQAGKDAEKAIAFSEQASIAAERARTSADSAAVAADDAQRLAGEVQGIADRAMQDAANASAAAAEAQESADEAHDTAVEAQSSADSAQASADSANQSARSALLSLEEIENVVGAAEWIHAHGTYSNDLSEFDASAIYYVPSASSPTGYAMVDDPSEHGMWSYALTTDVSIDPEKTYYTQSVTYTYDLTHDIEIVEGKAYYVYDAENDEYDEVDDPVAADLPTYYERTDTVVYTPVVEPDVSEISTYYERTSLYYVLDISESVQNYIATHLALDNEGLHIFGNAGDYNALLGIDGLDIRESGGTSVAKYGENFRVGKVSGVYLQGTPTRLAFTSSAGDIVYFGLDDQQVWSMFMEQAYVRDMIRFGNYAWVKRANGNLTMKYMED